MPPQLYRRHQLDVQEMEEVEHPSGPKPLVLMYNTVCRARAPLAMRVR